jgi:hypothetical protein
MGTVITNSDEIAKLVARNDVNRAFFDALGTRIKTSDHVTVPHVMSITKGERFQVVKLFKRMEEMGLGHFLVGRRGGQSRFAWSVRVSDLAQAYAGEVDIVESASGEDLTEDATVEISEVNHEFSLRPDFKVAITLPTDLTKREAERLAAFVVALPYD